MVELADTVTGVKNGVVRLMILVKAWVGFIPLFAVALVTAVIGGVKGAELLDIFFPPERFIELLEVAEGKSPADVGGEVSGGRVITLKFNEVGESKLTFVSAPKSPITRVLLSKVFN